jgi:hypothetical protein
VTSNETVSDAEERREHEISIIVDGQKKTVPSDIVSYIEVVELAYPSDAHDPKYNFTVTYRHADQEPHHGTLVAGQTVRVKKEGTVFNVTRTTKS